MKKITPKNTRTKTKRITSENGNGGDLLYPHSTPKIGYNYLKSDNPLKRLVGERGLEPLTR